MEQTTPGAKARVLLWTSKGNNKPMKYVLSNQDYLDLLRSVEFEGEPRDGVAWTLLQRFAFIYPQYKTLSTFLRAYVQPINPRWFPSGAKHKEWYQKLISAGKLNEAQDETNRAARRVHHAQTPVEKISKATKEIVDTVFSIPDSPVPGAVHYRAPTVQTKSVEEAKKARDDFGKKHYLNKPVDYGNILRGNWFWTTAASHTHRIHPLLVDASEIGKTIILALYLGGVGTLTYNIWKSYYG